MLLALSAAFAMFAQEADFPTDRETLGDYMTEACRFQQARDQGGEASDYMAFCGCLEEEIGRRTGDDAYRAIALGSQGANGEDAFVDNPEAALAEARRIVSTLPVEEAQGIASVLQISLMACMSEAPAQTSQAQ